VALVVRDEGPGLRTTNSRALIRLAISAAGRPSVGLLTVERVARLHGGALDLGAARGGGAEAVLTLPTA
jgi:signal transduction histidine kinase